MFLLRLVPALHILSIGRVRGYPTFALSPLRGKSSMLRRRQPAFLTFSHVERLGLLASQQCYRRVFLLTYTSHAADV
jgi:hypothetical protein